MPPESPLVFSTYAASQKLSEAKAVEAVKQGAEVYKKL
jgi:hypothetical protein